MSQLREPTQGFYEVIPITHFLSRWDSQVIAAAACMGAGTSARVSSQGPRDGYASSSGLEGVSQTRVTHVNGHWWGTSRHQEWAGSVWNPSACWMALHCYRP